LEHFSNYLGCFEGRATAPSPFFRPRSAKTVICLMAELRGFIGELDVQT
jgi:hypothetical protein